MPIGVKETQEIIRKAAVSSRHEASAPATLAPAEAGMATGPRHRHRALMRPTAVPDYLDPAEIAADEWQKLDDDIYKFLHLRKDQFGRMEAPPSHQSIAEVEARLRKNDPGYALGTYLGLLRQAADLDQTRQTYVTASEKGTFHAFARRVGEGRKRGETFDPEKVKRYRDLLDSNHPTTNRGLADLFRLVARAARMPLIGNLRDAPALCITVILEVVDISVRFNQRGYGRQEFQVGPMDVFLGARTVLFNRSVANPTLSMVKELVLDAGGLYHEDLLELLRDVGVFGSELTLLMPESLTEEGFALRGARYTATGLVLAAGARLAEADGPADRILATLSDAIVHKVQQQDGHKDGQIRAILGHFNRLLQGERRSAARLTEDRQQARFDYEAAIRRAGELAKGMQTGEFRALAPGADGRAVPAPRVSPRLLAENRFDAGDRDLAFRIPEPAVPGPGAAPALPRLPDLAFARRGTDPIQPAALVVGGMSAREYDSLLSEWDAVLVQARKRLTTRSPIFKSLASQLSKARALDACLAYGLTPAGGRAAGRLAKLLQDPELRPRLGISDSLSNALEDAFSRDYPGFLASVEALIATVYGFRPILHNLQFRLRDRLPAPPAEPADLRPARGRNARADGRETVAWADAGGPDETVLRLMAAAIRTALELSGTGDWAGADAEAIGSSDPFLAYCALLWRGKGPDGASREDPEANLRFQERLGAGDLLAMRARYQAWIGPAGRPSPLIPGLGATRLREGWARGFERGYMSEIQRIFGDGGADLEARLLERMTGIQSDIDGACAALEGEKMRLIRERVGRILE